MSEMWSSSKIVKNQKIKPTYFDIKKKICDKSISFNIHRYSDLNESKPRMFFSCFAEFGCETLLPTYLIPRIIVNFPDYKKVVVGWHGREYLYKHFIDEYWEVKPEFMKYRENCQAFSHNTRELYLLERHLSLNGFLVEGKKIGNLCVTAVCVNCSEEFGVSKGDITCLKCGSTNIKPSLFQGHKIYKNSIKHLPEVSLNYVNIVDDIIPNNSIALFARKRKTYGRNFTDEHYKKIVYMINDLGFNVVLLGEPISSLNFEHPNVINLLNHDLAGNLEFAFAVVQKCVCSLQLYTASTRIGALSQKPYILVESPDQIYGRGQEGIRLSLTTRDESLKKLVLSNYINAVDYFDEFVLILETAIQKFLFEKNYGDVFFKCTSFEEIKRNMVATNLW